MITSISPKLPMRNKMATREFYIDKLGFKNVGNAEYEAYLMVEKDGIQIHFFSFPTLDPKDNYGQVYIRTNQIEQLYEWVSHRVDIHPNGALEIKPWGQREFSILDTDNNLLTFGEEI